ncbi:NAD-dependent epimerase/dehydratase family protein [Shivajiella indica]|uniref:NAD-dependent epimerase/dehydratase family protein n=1 Tax=Shivajiella indica TaxID=872115 RepID=A0ABW5B9T8_9BACT
MKILVTGGGGFLGFAIVRLLKTQGHEVVSFSRHNYPYLDELEVIQFQGNLLDFKALKKAVEGCEVVFHVAAKLGMWGKYIDFFETNVLGTENVIQACKEEGVRFLVFTSSPSVVFDGKDSEGEDESLPYPKKYNAFYPQTKAMAEKLVISANNSSLKTVCLRPHLIWGPGDTQLLPSLIEKAKQGKLRIVGDGRNKVDCIYVENAAMAHTKVLDQMIKNPSKVEGKAYFISQGNPIPMAELIQKLLATAGISPVKKYLSPLIAKFLGRVLETSSRFLGIPSEPMVTLFLAQQLSSAHWFDISASKRDFGYEPEISIEEGMKHLTNWLSSIKDIK